MDDFPRTTWIELVTLQTEVEMTRHTALQRLILAALVTLAVSLVRGDDDSDVITAINKAGFDIDERSTGRILADEMFASGNIVLEDAITPVPQLFTAPQIQLRGGNVQANDGSLDNVQIFAGFRPFVSFTQSETSLAAHGHTIVATYNTSANQPLIPNPSGPGLVFLRRLLSGFSSSADGGQTWTSGFLPPVHGSAFTFGDPSVDVDRKGHFYFAGLGADAAGKFTIQVNTSTDGGATWSDAVVVQQDDGGDKEWIAVGPDPVVRSRDNVYVTWTSFQTTGAQLRVGRSIDGGLTWTTKTIFAPPTNPNPLMPQNVLQFSTPYVDQITGRLYVPFVQFSNSDEDFIRILASDDAGDSFHFLDFNVPDALLPSVLPIVQSGELIDMGSGGIRLGIHAGPASAGRFGLRQFVQVSRLISQPAFVARQDHLWLVWSNSTSPFFGDPTGTSNILLVRSDDGGTTWTAPIQVNPAVATDAHHVMADVCIDNDPNDVHVLYYSQHQDETVDVDIANSHDGGVSFPDSRAARVTSTNFVLPPTVIRLTAAPTPTTNYDRLIQPGYSLGEYLSVRSANGSVYALWGDARNSVTEPVNPLDPLSGVTHSQQDVFFQKVKAQ
jgi:hypothetical protein